MTEWHGNPYKPFDFIERQKFVAIHERDVFGRHAIETPKIAAIRHAVPLARVHPS